MNIKKATKNIGAVVLVLGVILISFWDFSQKIDNSVMLDKQSKLEEIVFQTARTLKTTFAASQTFVCTIANTVATFEQLTDPRVMEVLTANLDLSNFDRLAIAYPDGTTQTTDHAKINVADRDYFKQAMEGQKSISNVVTSRVSGKPVLVIAAPVMREGEAIACVYGVYSCAVLSASMQINTFDGQGYIHLFQKDGTFIVHSTHDNQLIKDNNINEFFEYAQFESPSDYDRLKRELYFGRSGFISYTYAGEKRVANYAPIGINDWYVMSVIPQNIVTDSSSFIKKQTITLACKMLIAFVLFLFYLFYEERRLSKGMEVANREMWSLASNIPGGVCKCSTDSKWEIAFVNEGFVKLFGYEPEEIKEKFGNQYHRLVYPADRRKLEEIFESQLKEGRRVEAQYRAVTKFGQVIWVQERSELITDAQEHAWFYCVLMDITATKTEEWMRKINEERYRIAMEESEHLIFEYDLAQMRMTFLNKGVRKYGLSDVVEEAPKFLVESGVIHPQSIKEHLKMYRQIHQGGKMVSGIFQIRTADGVFHWNKVTLTNVFDENGLPRCAIGVLEDVSEQKKAEQRLLQEQRYRQAILNDAIATYEVNLTQDRLVKGHECNGIPLEIQSSQKYSELLPLLAHKLVAAEDVDSFIQTFCVENVMRTYAQGIVEVVLEYRRISANGGYIWVKGTAHLMETASLNEVVCIFHVKNIETRKQKELDLQLKAERDSLSGLYNKGATENLITEFLKTSDLKNQLHALLIIDIDNFKNINDSAGHAYGDQVLAELGSNLRTIFRRADIIGRIGGDEFIVFLKEIGTEEMVSQKALEVCNAFKADHRKETYAISASVGIALCPQYGTTFAELYQHADIALYQSKINGKDSYTIYRGEQFERYQSERNSVKSNQA